MKTLKQIKEEYNDRYLEGFDAPEMVSLEENKQTIPSSGNMPQVLVFRRTSYRLYPNKQVVALYYSKALDKYLSIPFGPGGNLNLSEATILDEQEASATRYTERPTYEENKYPDAAERGIYQEESRLDKLHGFKHEGKLVGHIIPKDNSFVTRRKKGTFTVRKTHKTEQEAKDHLITHSKGLNEDWQSVNRKDKTDGLSQKAVNAYRRENPGSKLKTAVTEKNPTGKRASRRKSFCSRMGGMKKRLTSAKTANDPDSRINKALRRWNCEESFKAKLAEKRMYNEGALETADKVADYVVPYYGAGKKAMKGDWGGAAKEAAIDTAGLALGGVVGKVAGKLGARALGKFVTKRATATGTKTATKTATKSASKTAARTAATDAAKTATKGGALGALAGAAGTALSNLTNVSKDPYVSDGNKLVRDKPGVKTYSSWEKGSQGSPINKERQRQALMRENKITDIRKMINEGITSIDLPINGRSVTLNTSMAKRILEVYDSVNVKNKKIVEGMLNEDMESFKKLLNFSVRN